MRLNEVFNKPYPYRWIEKSDEAWKAEAQLQGGDYLTINFNTTDFNLTEWEINFQRGGDYNYKATGTGDEFRVFATVVAAIKEWFNKQRPKPREIFFSGDKEDTPNAESRIRLYDRFAKQFAQQTGYRVERNEMRMSVSWNFVRPKKKKRVQEVEIDNRNGRGAVPNNMEVDYFGMRVQMRPSTFVKLAAPLGRDASDEMKAYIAKGGAIGAPFLIINVDGDDVEVVGHEGRNRMIAVKAIEGDDPVETHLFFRGDVSRARHLTPEIVSRIRAGMTQEKTGKKVAGPLWEDGKIVPGVNTTVDVKPGETKRQAKKLGFKLNKKNEPPLLHSKARKNSDPHTLSNLGLTEAFNSPYKWQWTDDEYYDEAVFKTKDRRKGRVEFGDNGNDDWSVDFTVGGDSHTSSKGDAMAIFSTVMSIISQFMEIHEPEALRFRAFDDEDTGSQSRASLYTRMMNRFASQWGMRLSTQREKDATTFELTKESITETDYPIADYDEWYGDRQWKEQGAEMVMMSPDKYLKQVRPLQMDDESVENIDILAQHIKDGGTLDPLKIYPDGKEDGRHRAYAAKKLGIAEVPVIVWPRKEMAEAEQMLPLSDYNQDKGNLDWIVAQIDKHIASGDLSRFVKTVPVAALKASQDWLDDFGGGDPVFPDIEEDYWDYPVAALVGNELVVIDGHHRVNRALTNNTAQVELLVFPIRTNEAMEIKKPHPKDTLGVKRADMPQVHRDHYPELMKYLKDHGARITQKEVPATTLKATQGEFSDEGVRKMMRTGGRTSDSKDKKPLLVSSDNYIIDGHHRWLASYNIDETVPIFQFSIPVKRLLELVRDFRHTTYKDIYNEAMIAMTPIQRACIEGGHLYEPELAENLSVVGTKKHKEERKKKLKPGTEAWFKHWFDRPHLTREDVETMKSALRETLQEKQNEEENRYGTID